MAAHEPVCGRANIMDVIDKGEIYLTFVFDGIDSSQIGVASVSDGSTYDTPILPEFNDNSLEVDGYDGKYYFNTRLSQKSFTYNCFIDNLSAFEFDQLKSWIRPKKIGKLIRPEEPYRYYWVKVSSVDNLGNIPLTHPDTGGVSYTGNFSITFTTVGQTCGYGMLYYQDDLKYYEYRDIFDGTQDYYYDEGLLYREESLPMSVTMTSGENEVQIYNPGTYNSKIRAIISTDTAIDSGAMILRNETVGDVSVITLNGLTTDSKMILDWGENTYTLNGVDCSDKVEGDLMYLQPRNYVERQENASISNNGTNTMVSFDEKVRQVRTDDIGKTVMFKDEMNVNSKDGAGGRIIGIDKITNRFILDKSVGLYSNPNATVIITKLDKLSCELNIPEGQSINVEWQIVPRYL